MTTTLTEQALSQLVLSKLGQHRQTSGQTIDVLAVDGDIYLIGWCDSEDQRLIAELLARGTYGVRGVIDNIRVRRLAQAI